MMLVTTSSRASVSLNDPGSQPVHRPERFDALGDARDFLEAIAAREGQCLRAHGWSVGAPR